MEINGNCMVQKSTIIKNNKYICENCNYTSCRKSQYERHLLTLKHKRKHLEINNVPKSSGYKCDCDKKFETNSGLWKHMKKCDYKLKQLENIKSKTEEIIIENDNSIDFKSMFLQVMEKNNELLKTISELTPQIGNNITNNNTNNVKQKFNINVFLNEKCKDAISIDQFIDTIEVSMKNLLTTRDKGLGEGLSSIIIDNMNKLSLYERPMHCTDKKRETMYIKNQEWAKDDKLEQVDQLLKRVENKQLKNIKQWTDANPNFMESEKLQEEYIKLIKGCTSSIDECRGKTIKKVCDKVYLEKE